jgi:hypothetical protein
MSFARVVGAGVQTFNEGVSPLRVAALLRCASSQCQTHIVSPLSGCHR